jgi:hypothetical protein
MGAILQTSGAGSQGNSRVGRGIAKKRRAKNVTTRWKITKYTLHKQLIQLKGIVVYSTRQYIGYLISHPSNVVNLELQTISMCQSDDPTQQPP